MNRQPWTDANLAHLRKWAGIALVTQIAAAMKVMVRASSVTHV